MPKSFGTGVRRQASAEFVYKEHDTGDERARHARARIFFEQGLLEPGGSTR